MSSVSFDAPILCQMPMEIAISSCASNCFFILPPPLLLPHTATTTDRRTYYKTVFAQ